MTTKRHPAARLQRWIIVLMSIFALPILAHEGHGAETSPGATSMISDNMTILGESGVSEPADNASPMLASDLPIYRTIKYAGKFHVLVIHFPIAFLLAAAAAQWHVVLRNLGQPLVGVLLWTGTIGAVFAAALGWMYAYDSVYFGDDAALLSKHRWLGTSVAVLAASTLIGRPKLNPMGMAITLTLCAALVVAAAHYGGSLVYGPDYLVPAP